MRARTFLLVTMAVVALAGTRLQAITLEDVVELSRVGVGDVVLVELIEIDENTYQLPPARLRALKLAGVSDRVLLALLRSGRVAQEDAGVALPTDTRKRTTPAGCQRPGGSCDAVAPRIVAVPVLVPARPDRSTSESRQAGPRTPLGFGGVVGFNPLPTVPTATIIPAPREPVYWGWGGKKRPGSWTGNSQTTVR
jgi:hypothetical protein